jgi:hypothetical protein
MPCRLGPWMIGQISNNMLTREKLVINIYQETLIVPIFRLTLGKSVSGRANEGHLGSG